MIELKQAKTPAEMKQFVLFPFELYKDNNYWIPPIIQEELDTFNPAINPAFKTAQADFFLAYKNNKIVGRIAVIINWDEVNNQQKKKVRFGWFEVINDIEVTKILLEKAIEIGKKNNLELIEGPIGFSNLDKVGALTEGFDQMGNMITWYSPKYYIEHFETLGFTQEKEYLESVFPFENVKIEAFAKAADLISKRYQLRLLNFKNTKQLMPYVDEMFDLFNKSYEKLASFVAINDVQKAYFKKKYISFINPEYILFVMDKNNKMIAFSIVMPSFSEALQKAKGKLFPFGWYHLLKARKNSKDVVFYLIGIDPEYQNKGVTAIIFREYHRVFTKKGIKNCIRTPELAENNAIHNLWKNFNPVINKRRKTFSKEI